MGSLPNFRNRHEQLPVIDFSEASTGELSPGSSRWGITRSAVMEALRELGCFEAVYDPITLELHRAVFDALEELFDLPEETKRRFIDTGRPYDGYVWNLPHPFSPLYHAMGITRVLDDSNGAIERFTELMWLEGNPAFCETLKTYYTKVSNLEKMVKRMALEGLGVGKYYNLLEKRTEYFARATKYDAPMGGIAGRQEVGTVNHFDTNILTLLHQNQVNGLEIKTKAGDWIMVNPSTSSSFVVMTGESFLAWSNGRLHCPLHRVVMSGNRARYSIGLFSKVKGTVKCPEELIDEQNPPLFKPFEEIELVRGIRLFQSDDGWQVMSALMEQYRA